MMNSKYTRPVKLELLKLVGDLCFAFETSDEGVWDRGWRKELCEKARAVIPGKEIK
jgi:hypothetical protein